VGSGCQFNLTHDGDGSTTLPITFEWTNPVCGTYTMLDYSSTGITAPPSPFAPGATSCAAANSQNTITVTIASADLASAIAGTYSETLSIDACRVNGGGGTVECEAAIEFIVDIPELIQITQLQNFNFGSWSGVGDIQGVNPFCVFRNGSGGFAVTATGVHDSGGNFNVVAGAESLRYIVELGAGGGWFELTPGAELPGSTSGFEGIGTRNCGGGTSHSIRLTMAQTDLDARPAGNYSDTITLVVAPD